MFWSTAYAQVAGAPAQPSTLEMLIPFVGIFLVFYFLIIRPQSKKQKEQLSFIQGLQRGDEVITASGILGKIDGLTEQFVTLEVADGVKIKFLRSQISSSQKAAIASAQAAQSAAKKEEKK
ncbi:MAG: preprotein translocase subunit YajC [Pseudobdellovibrionaceae bacterium]